MLRERNEIKMSGIIRKSIMKKRLISRCLLVYNTVWIIFGLLINDSSLPVVLRPAECGYLMDRSIDWGRTKQRKASVLGHCHYQPCAAAELSPGHCHITGGTGYADPSGDQSGWGWGPNKEQSQTWVAASQGLHGAQGNAGAKERRAESWLWTAVFTASSSGFLGWWRFYSAPLLKKYVPTRHFNVWETIFFFLEARDKL